MEDNCRLECWNVEPEVLAVAQAIASGMPAEKRKKILESLKGRKGKYAFVSGEAGIDLQVAEVPLTCAVCLLGLGLKRATHSARRRMTRFYP